MTTLDHRDFDLYDDDGYPTDEAIAHLESFEGTPAQMVEFAGSLYNGGNIRTVDAWDDFQRPVKRIVLTTGGWSGAEQVTSALNGTLFHSMFWQSSERGGRYVYEVPERMWEHGLEWGVPGREKSAKTEGVLHLEVTVVNQMIDSISVPVNELRTVAVEDTKRLELYDDEAVVAVHLLHGDRRYERTQNAPVVEGGKALFSHLMGDGNDVSDVVQNVSTGLLVDGQFWELLEEGAW